MPRIVTAGVVALDDVKTPFGEVQGALGGSATFASFAASFFSDTGLVGIVGGDFPRKHLELLRNRMCTQGLEIRGQEKTFHWGGYYEGDMNSAITSFTELNSLQGFSPVLPGEYTQAEYLLLANAHPALQLRAIEQMKRPKIIALDTMNYWINNNQQELLKAVSLSNIFFLNETEARLLFRTQGLDTAARQALNLGPSAVVIKRGSEGASLYIQSGRYDVPAVKLEKVLDPTGAGDSFAGGFMGFLARQGDSSEPSLKRAMLYGTVMASFTVQGFSLEGLKNLTLEQVEKRLEALK